MITRNAFPAIVFESYKFFHASAGRLTTSTGTTDCVDVTETGILMSVSILTWSSMTGNYTMNLEIIVDGGATQTFAVATVSTAYEDLATRSFAINGASGNTAYDNAVIPLGLRYETSLKVSLNCTASNSNGRIQLSVLRGQKI